MKKFSSPLDLSARAYPMMKTRRTQSNFRFSVRLTSAVAPDALNKALADVIPLYPNLNARIAPAFFWHKFKQNDASLIVKEDSRPPLTPLRKEDTHGYPFRLAYKEDQIVLEVFHAATDGDGGAMFLSDLLTRYVEIVNDLPTRASLDRGLTLEDPFVKNASPRTKFDVSLRNYNGAASVALGKRGNYLDSPTLLSAEISVADLKAAAKSLGATVTEYIAACYISAIAERQPLPLSKPICLFVPVNLRRFFPSKTLLNFVCFERVVLPKGESDLSFSHLIEIVHQQFAQKITQQNMQRRVDDVKQCFSLAFVNYLPLFIKQPCFKLIKKITNKVRQTAILSNIGKFNLPPETAPYVQEVKLYLNVGKNAPLNVAILSYGEVCHVNMTCGLKETDIPERFFALLKGQGNK